MTGSTQGWWHTFAIANVEFITRSCLKNTQETIICYNNNKVSKRIFQKQI